MEFLLNNSIMEKSAWDLFMVLQRRKGVYIEGAK
jgi:hypothetical protein